MRFNRPIRILLSAPGTIHSTYDIFNYYLDAMKDSPEIEVQAFNFHNIITWQKNAVRFYKPDMDETDAAIIACSRASRELLVDIVTFQPDVVFVISGTVLPDFVWQHMVKLQEKFKETFTIALYLTESPYIENLQSMFVKYPNVLFVNDKVALETYKEYNTHYLPHSYNPKIHKPVDDGIIYDSSEYTSDIFFAGTPFAERGEMLANINWNNLNFKLGGNWIEYCRPEDYLVIMQYLINDGIIDNDIMARFYGNTKVALNIHRTRGDIEGLSKGLDNHTDAYSMGPRLYEAVACGAFLLTDYRQEAVDIYGDTIGMFDGTDSLQSQIEYWTDEKHDTMRQEKVSAAQEKIKFCTFSDRLDTIILPVLSDALNLK